MATYNKNVWHTGDVITEDKLNNLEDGIESIVTSVNTANTAITDVNNGVTAITETVDNIQSDVSAIATQVDNIHLEDITEALNTASDNIAANNELITNNQDAINQLLVRLNTIENVVDAINATTNTEIITNLPEGVSNFFGLDKKLVITNANLTSDTSDAWLIHGKSVALNASTADSVTIKATADNGDVILTHNTITGTLAKSVSNAMLSINTNYEVVINGCDIAQNGYNAIEIGLNNTTPYRVTIKDCNFTGNLTNNAISIFATEDDCVVTIENCHFSNVSNVLRLSNRTNANNVTINFVNCSWDHLDSNTDWKGVVICQDYTSASKAETIEANRFGNNKIAISFTDCVGENGTPVTLAEDGSHYVTGDNCLVYVYCNKWDNEAPGKVSNADMPEMFPIVGA